MNTLILNGTAKDLRLLLDFSKKIGIDLKVVKEKTKPQSKGLSAALALSKTRKATKISQQDIVDECREVRKKRYEK
ncbi:hypothetical protein [Capnocytophaga canis]|uniref:hypothetical protein n=1 Tax=Capnocytophaga canis TaxID=1848903 RepID=UPI0037D3494D